MSTINIAVVKGGTTVPYELPINLKVWQDTNRPAGHHMFRVMDQRNGDTRIVWNSDILEEIQDAKRMFEDLVCKGLVPYRVDEKGQRTPEEMQIFDPTAEEVIFVPIKLVVGG